MADDPARAISRSGAAVAAAGALRYRLTSRKRWSDASLNDRSSISRGEHAMSAKPQTIDEYLAPLRFEKRAALEKLRGGHAGTEARSDSNRRAFRATPRASDSATRRR